MPEVAPVIKAILLSFLIQLQEIFIEYRLEMVRSCCSNFYRANIHLTNYWVSDFLGLSMQQRTSKSLDISAKQSMAFHNCYVPVLKFEAGVGITAVHVD